MRGRLFRCSDTISRRSCRALYSVLREMVGLYVARHSHLAKNKRDLDGIAMRMRGEHIEIFIFLVSNGSSARQSLEYFPCVEPRRALFVRSVRIPSSSAVAKVQPKRVYRSANPKQLVRTFMSSHMLVSRIRSRISRFHHVRKANSLNVASEAALFQPGSDWRLTRTTCLDVWTSASRQS